VTKEVRDVTAEGRDRVREQLLACAEADSAVTGVAFTGSHATGAATAGRAKKHA